jgi:hypothetical protein
VAVVPGVVTNSNLRTDEGSLVLGLGSEGVVGRGELGQVLLGKLDELVVVDRSGSGEDHLVGVQVLGSVLKEVLSGDGLDVLVGSEDVVSEGLACRLEAKRRGRESVVIPVRRPKLLEKTSTYPGRQQRGAGQR